MYDMSKLLIILLVQLLYVPMLTLRTISMVKNLKMLTAVFGFLEAAIYIFGLAIVLSGKQSFVEMLIYALGFSMGLVAGIFIEQKLAIGYSSFNVNINHDNDLLIQELRDNGFGVTVYVGEGRNGTRIKLDVLTQRKRETELLERIKRHEPNAFIISYEPKTFSGGYLSEMMKKRLTFNRKNREPIAEETTFIDKTIGGIKEEVSELTEDWKN